MHRVTSVRVAHMFVLLQVCECWTLSNTTVKIMDKGSLGSKRAKVTSYWGNKCDHGSVDTGRTEYLTRLTSLRDSLIKQEQLYLAKAIDRLRMQSLSNKTSSDRLRIHLPDAAKRFIPTTTTPSMMTTVEKFRQMRPPVTKPVIHPLVGKQIFAAGGTMLSPSDELLDSLEGSAHNMDPGHTADHTSSLTTLFKADDLVDSNLLRVSQTTCSIPTTDRKARMNPESLEAKTKSIHNLRSTLYRQKGKLFLPFQKTKSLSSSLPSHGSTDITTRHLQSQDSSGVSFPIIYSQDAWKRDVYFTDDDINKEDDSNHKDIIVNNRSDSHERRRGSVSTENWRGHWNRPQALSKIRFNNSQRMLCSQSTLKKRKDTDRVSNISSDLYSYNHCPAVQYANRDVPGVDGRFTEYIHGVIQLLPDRSYRASIKNGIVYVHGIEDESDAETLDNTDTRLPDMVQSDNDISVLNGDLHNHILAASAANVCAHNIPVANVQHGKEILLDTNKESQRNETGQHVDVNKTQKKHIIVEMPTIIFSGASPAQDLDDSLDEGQNENQQSHVVQSPLRKVAQQQQVRMRELTNLLEDVKELSMKTEALKLQSAI